MHNKTWIGWNNSEWLIGLLIKSGNYDPSKSVSWKVSENVLSHLKTYLTMETYWVPDLPNIKSIPGHFRRCIFIFTNGASFVWSSRHINLLAPVCGPVWRFSSWKSLTYWNQVVGDWNRVSCYGNKFFIAAGVFPIELLACKVSMVCAANCQDRSIYVLEIIELFLYDFEKQIPCVFVSCFIWQSFLSREHISH